MVLDIIAVILVVVFFIRGYMKGLIVAAFSVLAIILGIFCALKLSERLATWLMENDYVTSGWAQVVSYAILFMGVMLLVRLVAKALESGLKVVMLGWANKAAGGLLYAMIGVVVWSTFLWLGREVNVVTDEHIAESKTYEYVAPVAPMVAEKVGVLWPMAKDLFNDLEFFFDTVNAVHVDTDR